MKKILLSVGIALGSYMAIGQITVYPYSYDFENEITGPTGCNPTYTMQEAGWNNAGGDDMDWTNDFNATGSTSTGPNEDHTAAGTFYMYVEASCAADRTTYLETPVFDFTSLTAPSVAFWYHMYGSDMQTLSLEVSSDGGITWNNEFSLTGQQQASASDAWLEATVNLSVYAGIANVQMRFVGTTSAIGFNGDMAIDDFSVSQPAPIDMELTSVDSLPPAGCGLGFSDVYTTTTQVGSTGLNIGDSLVFTYSDGTNNIMDTVILTAALAQDSTYSHMFSSPADYSTPGTYNYFVSVWNSADGASGNDTLFGSVTNIPINVVTIPYHEDFESGQNGWEIYNTTGGASNGSWAYGTPAKATIIGAASGDSAFVTGGLGTGLYNSNENAWVESPCFDLTNVDSTAWVSMNVWWESEFSWDGANLQSSIDGGATWTNIGAVGSPADQMWYTDNTINGTPGGSQEGWTGRNDSNNGSGGWVTAKHPIPSLAGQDVRFRVNFGSDGSVQDDGFGFDDFKIGVPEPLDTNYADYNGCAPFSPSYGNVGTYVWYSQDTSTLVVTALDTTANGNYVFTNTGSTVTTFNMIAEYTDFIGCKHYDTVLVTLNPTPYNVFADTTICYDGTATFNAIPNAGYTYAWNNGSTVDSATYVGANMVMVTVTDTVSGCSHVATANINATPAVDLPATDHVCTGDTIMVDAGSYDTWNWSTGDTTQMIAVTTAGSYIVNTTDAIGCASADTVVVTESLPMPTVSSSADSICANDDVILDAGAGFAGYSWSTGGTAQSETVAGASLSTGVNTITVTVTDADGCSNSDSYDVFVDPCAGIVEIAGTEIELYPNPTNGMVNYVFSNIVAGTTITVTDLAGKVVSVVENVTSNGSIDLSKVDAGVYIFNIQFGSQTGTVRVVKQ